MATASRGRCDTLGHWHWRKRTQLVKYQGTQRPRVALLGGTSARRRMRGQGYFTLRERAVMGVSSESCLFVVARPYLFAPGGGQAGQILAGVDGGFEGG